MGKRADELNQIKEKRRNRGKMALFSTGRESLGKIWKKD